MVQMEIPSSHSVPRFERTGSATRRRVGCQECRNRRRKCDRTVPECAACLRRGLGCSGYERPVVFKDVSRQTADYSRRIEAVRWSALRRADAGRSAQGQSSAQQEGVPPGMGKQRILPHNPAPEDPLSEIPMDEHGALGWQPLFETSIDFLPGDLFALSSSDAEFPTPSNTRITIGEAASQTATVNLPHMEAQASSPSTFLIDFASPMPQPDNGDELIATALEKSTDPYINSQMNPWKSLQTTEELCVNYFEHEISQKLPVSLEFANWYRGDSCFRSAILALTAATARRHKDALPHNNPALKHIEDAHAGQDYYNTALGELRERIYDLDSPNVPQGDSLAGATLILAYHDMQMGSSLGIRHQAFTLDLIASKTRTKLASTPELLKAWRLLRCDKRFISMPTRTRASDADDQELIHHLSPELTIRDLFLAVWKTHTRYAVEATFSSPTVQGQAILSGARQSGQWLRTVLNRDSDHRQARQDDYHHDNLTKNYILKQCDEASVRLDKWHSTLSTGDIPVIRAGSSQDFITVSPFDPFPTYRIDNEGKAINYLLYLLSRMTCAYLRSLFNHAATASATQAWGNMIMGLACGAPMQRQKFTTISVDELLFMTALLSEGTQTTTLLLDHLVPLLLENEATDTDKIPWLWIKRALQIVHRERLRGKALRFMVDGSNESSTTEDLQKPHAIAGFGDYNGKGFFRDIYQI